MHTPDKFEQAPLSSSQEKKLKQIVGSRLWETLEDADKHELIAQIEQVEKNLGHNNSVKIRVRPKMINLIRKLTGVHDIRGGAYRGDTIYLGHSDDLFNPDLIPHEDIHVNQQSELSTIKFIGFIKWLIKASKYMSEYKKQHGDSPYITYESTTLIPTELEAYVHQSDKNYMKNRQPLAFKTYETPEGEQKALQLIGKRNDQEIRQQLEQPLGVDWNTQNDTLHALERLDQIMQETADKERTMRAFNTVDKVNELARVKDLLEQKIALLTYGFKDGGYEFLLRKFKKQRAKYEREVANANCQYLLEDDFTHQKAIHHALATIAADMKKYRREPAKFWLEPKNKKDPNIEIQLS